MHTSSGRIFFSIHIFFKNRSFWSQMDGHFFRYFFKAEFTNGPTYLLPIVQCSAMSAIQGRVHVPSRVNIYFVPCVTIILSMITYYAVYSICNSNIIMNVVTVVWYHSYSLTSDHSLVTDHWQCCATCCPLTTVTAWFHLPSLILPAGLHPSVSGL